MASSERKRKHRQMRELGWWWEVHHNRWTNIGASHRWVIAHDGDTNQWLVEAFHPHPSFDCYLTAAIWAAVEVSNG